MHRFTEFLQRIDKLTDAELRQIEIRIVIRRQQLFSAAEPRCTCALAYGPAENVPGELHDEDCLLYLATLASEEAAERFKTLRSVLAEDANLATKEGN